MEIKNIRFCYEISEEAEMAQDELGNPAKAYMCVKVPIEKELTEEEYKITHGALKKVTASQIDFCEDLITPISLDEYLDNTEDDE